MQIDNCNGPLQVKLTEGNIQATLGSRCTAVETTLSTLGKDAEICVAIEPLPLSLPVHVRGRLLQLSTLNVSSQI